MVTVSAVDACPGGEDGEAGPGIRQFLHRKAAAVPEEVRVEGPREGGADGIVGRAGAVHHGRGGHGMQLRRRWGGDLNVSLGRQAEPLAQKICV